MVGPGAQVGSKGGFGSPKLLQVEPTHTSSKQKMHPKLGKFKQSHIQNKHQSKSRRKLLSKSTLKIIKQKYNTLHYILQNYNMLHYTWPKATGSV